MALSEAQRRAVKKYKEKATTAFSFRLSNDADRDVIDHLAKQENRTDYIRKLVREDMRKEGEGK